MASSRILGPGMMRVMWLRDRVCFYQCILLQVLRGGGVWHERIVVENGHQFVQIGEVCSPGWYHSTCMKEFTIQLLNLLKVVCLFGFPFENCL